MKRFNLLMKLTLMLVAAFMFSCEGPEGPMGPAGADGIDGVDGTNGTDGADGADGQDGVDGQDGQDNTTCIVCHNTTVNNTLMAQWTESGHGIGSAVGYAGGRAGCADCHSHEGFTMPVVNVGGTNAGISNPTPIGCQTCHSDHVTFDQVNEGPDYAIRTNEPVELMMDESGTVVDLGNNSNLCVNCHQPRRSGPEDMEGEVVTVDGVDVTIGAGESHVSSSHYGPHYGTQSTVLVGYGMSDFGTAFASSSQPHDCTRCHMQEDENELIAHSWNVTIDGDCTDCHSATGLADVQSGVADKMETLATHLVTAGLLSGNATDGYSPVVGVFPLEQVKALYNYRTIYGDHSYGIHNPDYVNAALDASIAVFAK